MNGKIRYAVIVTVALAAMLILGCGSSDKTTTTDDNAGTGESTQAEETVDYSNLAMGTTVDLDGLKLAVNSAQAGPTQYDGSASTVVNVTYTNDSKNTASFNPYQ